MSSSAGDKSPEPGKKYRFVVASAAEAANVIREKLGENAKVLSVRQIEGEGLAKFLRAPKLEVIAHIPAGVPAAPPTQPAPPPGPPSPLSGGQAEAHAQAARSAGAAQAAAPSRAPAPEFRLPGDPESPAAQEAAARPGQAAKGEPATRKGGDPQPPPQRESTLMRLMKRAGLPDSFLLRFSGDPEWRALEEMPFANAFPRAVLHLRKSIPERTIPGATRRVAFFGSPGVGSTTALCKQLASEVFLRARPACVMKLDGEEPNSTEGLAMYCEALGIPLLRSASELLEIDPEMIVYFDVPGAISDERSRARLRRSLSDLGIDTRVLVINGAYERQLIQHFYQCSTELAATHVVFTHLDELLHFGKLWEFVLDPGLAPLFGSTGPNLAGDCERDLASFLVRKTLATVSKK